MSRSVIRVLAAALLSVAVLAGCSVHPGVAAIVDGRTMSQADLATSYAQLKPILTKAEPSSLLAGLIGAPEVVKVAEKNGAGSSDDDAKKLLDSVAKQAGVTPSGEWTSDALLLAKSDLGYQKLQAMGNGAALIADINSAIAALHVQVNPQYGTWSKGTIAATAAPWIAASK
jgi:outer membrane murein-binding lipoprotein Lpp